jgi:hypothetical protein
MESDMGSNMESLETFWGTELTSKDKVYSYNGNDDEEEGLETTFEIRGICLGIGAKPNERNIISLSIEDEENEGKDKDHVIGSLKLDSLEQTNLLLSVDPPFKLKLLEGSGPVHVTGQMVTRLVEEDDDDDDDDDNESEEEEVNAPRKLLMIFNTV